MRFRDGTAAAERMGRPPLRNTDKGTEVELVVSNDRRQTVRYLAEITGCGNPAVHMILKSDLKTAQASARCIPHLLLEDDCGHNQASYNCKLSDVFSNSNYVRRWVIPMSGKMSAQTSLLDIFP